jgi:TRAP-type C4-dicarboxylate transport system permease small subunit
MADPAKLSRRLDPWTKWGAFLGFLLLIGAAVATLLDVVLRWMFNTPIEGWDDLSRLVFAIVIVACFPAGLLQGHNITIRFLGAGLGRRPAQWLEWFGAAMTLIFFGLMAWQFVVLTVDLRASGDTTMTAQIITWPWWTLATVLVLFCVPVQAIVLIGHSRRAVTGDEPGGTVEPDHGSEAGEI